MFCTPRDFLSLGTFMLVFPPSEKAASFDALIFRQVGRDTIQLKALKKRSTGSHLSLAGVSLPEARPKLGRDRSQESIGSGNAQTHKAERLFNGQGSMLGVGAT